MDFAATPPVVIARLGPPDTSGERCLGVELDASGTQLLVSSDAAGKVAPYGIELEPGTKRGIAITNGGDFVLFDAGAIPAISERWPTF